MDGNHSYDKINDNSVFFDTSKSTLEEIPQVVHGFKNVRLYVKRDDLIDTEVSGNKWRKLALNIDLAIALKKDGILTFGGAYSNHLLATASACFRIGLKSIGVVRGDELSENSNANLKRCAELGMELIFVSRTQYDCRCEVGELESWKEKHPTFHLVPEGGSNYYGTIGCQHILEEISFIPDHVFVAQGTTTTSCGVLLSLTEQTKLHVVPVLKGFDSLVEMRPILYQVLMDWEAVEDYLKQVEVHANAHFGGYGKWNNELEDFITFQNTISKIPLDKVYTGKAFWAMWEWLKKSDFKNEVSVVFIHTGGLLNA